MNNRILKYGLLAFLWLVYTLPAMADYPDSPGSGENEDEVPINNWELLLVLAAIMLAIHYLILNKRKVTD